MALTIFYIFQPARRQATATVSQKDRDGIQLNTEMKDVEFGEYGLEMCST